MENYPFELKINPGFTGNRYGKKASEMRSPYGNSWEYEKEVLAGLFHPNGKTFSLYVVYEWQGFAEGRAPGFFYACEYNPITRKSDDVTLPNGKYELLVHLSKKVRNFSQFDDCSNHKHHSFEILTCETPYISKKILKNVATTLGEKVKKHLDFYFSTNVSCEITGESVGMRNHLLLHLHNPSLEDEEIFNTVSQIFQSYHEQFASLLLEEERKDRLSSKKVNFGFGHSSELVSMGVYGHYLSKLNKDDFEKKELFSITLDGYTIGVEYQAPRKTDYYGSMDYRYKVFTKRFRENKKYLASVTDNIILKPINMIRCLTPYFEKHLGVILLPSEIEVDSVKKLNPSNLIDTMVNELADLVSFDFLDCTVSAEIGKQFSPSPSPLVFYTFYNTLSNEEREELCKMLSQMALEAYE